MKKRKFLVSFITAALILFNAVAANAEVISASGNINPVSAVTSKKTPVIYQSTFTVTDHGGVFNVGFVNIDFPKYFLGKGADPINFDASIYAEDGQVYINFSPNAGPFVKDVVLHVSSFDGFIYDKAAKKNIFVSIKSKKIFAEHFSRYALGP